MHGHTGEGVCEREGDVSGKLTQGVPWQIMFLARQDLKHGLNTALHRSRSMFKDLASKVKDSRNSLQMYIPCPLWRELEPLTRT